MSNVEKVQKASILSHRWFGMVNINLCVTFCESGSLAVLSYVCCTLVDSREELCSEGPEQLIGGAL